MSEEQMKQELERLRAENAALKQTSAKGLSMKISEKGGLSIYGLTTRRDFSGMGAKLFVAVLALVAASIVGLFFASSLLQLGIGLAGSVIFSLYILYEVQQARRAEDTLGNAIVIAIGLYLSIFNLFLSLLRVLGLFGSSDE